MDLFWRWQYIQRRRSGLSYNRTNQHFTLIRLDAYHRCLILVGGLFHQRNVLSFGWAIYLGVVWIWGSIFGKRKWMIRCRWIDDHKRLLVSWFDICSVYMRFILLVSDLRGKFCAFDFELFRIEFMMRVEAIPWLVVKWPYETSILLHIRVQLVDSMNILLDIWIIRASRWNIVCMSNCASTILWKN